MVNAPTAAVVDRNVLLFIASILFDIVEQSYEKNQCGNKM
jgi:hypothetical protein